MPGEKAAFLFLVALESRAAAELAAAAAAAAELAAKLDAAADALTG